MIQNGQKTTSVNIPAAGTVLKALNRKQKRGPVSLSCELKGAADSKHELSTGVNPKHPVHQAVTSQNTSSTDTKQSCCFVTRGQ